MKLRKFYQLRGGARRARGFRPRRLRRRQRQRGHRCHEPANGDAGRLSGPQSERRGLRFHEPQRHLDLHLHHHHHHDRPPTTLLPRPRARQLLALPRPASSPTFRTPPSPTLRPPRSPLLLPPLPRSFRLRPSPSPPPLRPAPKPPPPASSLSIPASALPSTRPPPLFLRARISSSSPPSPTTPRQTTSPGRSLRSLCPSRKSLADLVTCSPTCGSISSHRCLHRAGFVSRLRSPRPPLPGTPRLKSPRSSLFQRSMPPESALAASRSFRPEPSNSAAFRPPSAPQGGILQDVYLAATNVNSLTSIFFDGTALPSYSGFRRLAAHGWFDADRRARSSAPRPAHQVGHAHDQHLQSADRSNHLHSGFEWRPLQH